MKWFVSRLLCVSVACAAFSATAWAQGKVAVIDMRAAVNGTAEVKKVVQEIEAKFKPKQAEGQKLQAELQDIQNKLQSLQGKLNAQGEADLIAEGQRKQKQLQRLQEDLNAELEREQNEVGSRVLQRMREIVKKMAEEQQIDIVTDVSQTIYFKPALDLTQAAIAAYDKAYPLK